jgi:hypothetical protein
MQSSREIYCCCCIIIMSVDWRSRVQFQAGQDLHDVVLS